MKKENKKELYNLYQSTHFGFIRAEAGRQNKDRAFDAYYGSVLPKEKTDKIVDIACGSGDFLSWLKNKGYNNIFGIDISKEQIERARKNIGNNEVEMRDVFEFLKDKKDNFDMIIALDLIEHLEKEEILELLRLIYEALKTSGRLLLSVPNAETLFAGSILYGDFTHEIAFTRASLSQVLRLNGFQEIKFLKTEPIVHGFKSFVRFLIWKAIKQLIKIYFLAETGSVGSRGYSQTLSFLAVK